MIIVIRLFKNNNDKILFIMKLTIKQTLLKAIAAHKLGKIEEAEHLYGLVLKTQTTNVDANHNLGVLLVSQNKLTEALPLFKTAIETNPNTEQFWISYAKALIKDNKFEEAEIILKKAVMLKLNFYEVYNHLSIVLHKLGRFDEAKINLEKVIELKPDYAEAHSNLGIILKRLGKIDQAEKSYRNAIKLKPNNAEVHHSLGILQFEIDKIGEAEKSYRKVIELKPTFVEAHCNLGNVLQTKEKFKEAEASYQMAIKLKPDYAEPYSNLGNTLYKLERLEEAEKYFRKALELKPDYTAAHNNLGNVLNDIGDLVSSINSYKQALNIQSDFAATWQSIFFPMQGVKLQTSSTEDPLPLLDKQASNKYAQVAKSILNYRLNQGSSSTDISLNETLSILSSNDNASIKNPKIPITELITVPNPPKKITAMVHFGRSGTGLMHSLIDSHPEISTLPSIYFSEFFDHLTWKKIIAGGWEEMADRFAKIYAVLFDASPPNRVATKSGKFIDNIGRKEGMTNVGKERDEVLSVDKKVFIKELKHLMNYHDHLDIFIFFKLVHSAYEKALNNHNEKKLIFYHIHNPDTYAQLNFLRLAPSTNWLMMVREPVQSCESWLSKNYYNNDYKTIANKIFDILFAVDQSIFKSKNSIGVRLEDLKEYPKKTIQALCDWLGIKENESLYQMTAQGKKWWGDPTSPDFKNDGMSPFGKTSINRKLGTVFSKNDQFILNTLFYPFSVHFGYTQENLEKFKIDLLKVRPMLDQMFDFEKKIAQYKRMDNQKFMKSGSYLFLRSGMIERWNTLNKFHTYPNMLNPLKINLCICIWIMDVIKDELFFIMIV